MREKIQLLIADLRSGTDAHTHKSGKRYKQDYNRRVWETSVFKLNDFVYIDSPPLRSDSENTAKAMAKQTNNKLQQRTARHFRKIKV